MSTPFKMKGFPQHAGTSPAKQKVQIGKVPYMNVDISTKEGKDILHRFKNIPTISSSDPSRITPPDVAKQMKQNMLQGKTKKVKKPKLSITEKVIKYGKKGGKYFGGLVGMMLTPKQAGATSTLENNPYTKGPEFDTQAKIRHTLTKNKMMPSDRKKK